MAKPFAIAASTARKSDLGLNSREALVASNGEFNASSKSELTNLLVTLANAVQDGKINMHGDQRTVVTAAEKLEARQHLIDAYYSDQVSGKWQSLGSDIATTIQQQANREGFMRRLLVETPLAQGNVARVRMAMKNSYAVAQSSAAGVQAQFVRDNFYTPPEFYITGNVEVEELELAQSSSDVLSEKYFEGLEAIMVAEDRYLKGLLDKAVVLPGGNALTILASSYSPTNHQQLLNNVSSRGVSPETLLMASDIIVDITGNGSFGTWFDPVSRLEIVRTGMVGTLGGTQIITDMHRRALNFRVLSRGEIYVTAKPEQTGAFTTRGEPQVTERNGQQQPIAKPTRGWSFIEMTSIVVTNIAAVSKAIRS